MFEIWLDFDECEVFQALSTYKIHTNDVFGRYSEVLEGLGCLESSYNVTVVPNIQPSVVAPKSSPSCFENEINAELD